jgi:HAD superfamily hydrolase (TIGR01549 family)
MISDIEAIFLDVGNTLRILLKDETYQSKARQQIAKLVETNEAPDVFCEKLDERYKNYRKWAFENLVEASEAELWTRWLAPEFSAEKIASQAVELTYQYRQSMGRRVVAEDGKQVIIELNRRGYIMGIISNVITSKEIPDWLEEDGLAKYFKSVVLSSVLGRRKPDPIIYHEAARIAGVEPVQCVYVGDNPKRDVVGTRKAGFGMVIIMSDPKDQDELVSEENKPDLIIQKLSDLLDYFPERQVLRTG